MLSDCTVEKRINFQQNPFNISHLTLTLFPHYLGKLKD